MPPPQSSGHDQTSTEPNRQKTMTTQNQESLLLEQRSQARRIRRAFKPSTGPHRQTAIIICDMWDDHTCKAAARRVAEMVPTMNRMVSTATRDRRVSSFMRQAAQCHSTVKRRNVIALSKHHLQNLQWKSSGTIGILNVKGNPYLSYGTMGAAVARPCPGWVD